MQRPDPIRSINQSLAFDGDAILYVDRYPVWLRVFVFSWALVIIPALFWYAYMLSTLAWRPFPVLELLFLTLLGVIAPLVWAVFIVRKALFEDEVHLRLDPAQREAVLVWKAPVRRGTATYPLEDVEIASVELSADNISTENDYPLIVLRLPSGRDIRMNMFFRDSVALDWAGEIETLTRPRTA